jgi:hypothetical protein
VCSFQGKGQKAQKAERQSTSLARTQVAVPKTQLIAGTTWR